MPGPSKRLEAGQQDELVGTAAGRVAGGVSAVWRSRGEFKSQYGDGYKVATPATGSVVFMNVTLKT